MHAKYLAAALTLTLGLTSGGPSLAAGETAARSKARPAAKAAKAVKRPAAPGATVATPEDILGRTVFQVLIGEFALQRGDTRLGSDAWSDLAARTRDPKVIARATEVAGFARQYDKALELTRLWLEVEPDSIKARQTQSSLLILSNRIDELAPQLAALLERDPANLGNNLLQLNRILARHGDKKVAQKLVDRLAGPYDGLPEAHFAMAQAAASAEDYLRALNETEKALQLRPDWETAALARAQLQARYATSTAIDSLGDFVGREEDARDARLALARLLINEKRYTEARVHFDRLIKDNPDNPEVIYPVAMLALQQGDATTGRSQLEHLLKTDFPDKSSVHFFLGQLDEEQKKPDAAIEHYRQVAGGEQYVLARSRAAQILLREGKLEEARELLHTAAGNSAERTQLLLAEAQLLRDANRPDEALSLLESALARQPDNPELLYETALMAERLGKPDILENRLKRLIELRPDHAHALNALGYSLAERNVRLDEAERLIAKAVGLAPEDPFIIDSQGWVFFRQGRLPEALRALERAYALKADPEIAAHLGEVLWRLGRKEDARRILHEAAKLHPDNEVLSGTVKKLLP